MLYKPSELSPNFDEVLLDVVSDSDVGDPKWNLQNNIELQFQVNANGSSIRSYKIDILNDKNYEEKADDNILATIYGSFVDDDNPNGLFNKDIATIYISPNQLRQAGLDLSNLNGTEDLRWRVRLYEDDLAVQQDEFLSGATYTGSGNLVGTTKNVIWLEEANHSIVKDSYIEQLCHSGDSDNDFRPFKDNGKNGKKFGTIKADYSSYDPNNPESAYRLAIDLNDIEPKYLDKLSSGDLYLTLMDADEWKKVGGLVKCVGDASSATMGWDPQVKYYLKGYQYVGDCNGTTTPPADWASNYSRYSYISSEGNLVSADKTWSQWHPYMCDWQLHTSGLEARPNDFGKTFEHSSTTYLKYYVKWNVDTSNYEYIPGGQPTWEGGLIKYYYTPFDKDAKVSIGVGYDVKVLDDEYITAHNVTDSIISIPMLYRDAPPSDWQNLSKKLYVAIGDSATATSNEWGAKRVVKINGLKREGNQTYLTWDKNCGTLLTTYYQQSGEKRGNTATQGTPFYLVYRQREKVLDNIDAIGQQSLSKITLKDSMMQNQMDGSAVYSGLTNDDLDYNKLYIQPVNEFDSKKSGNAFIHIFNSAERQFYDDSNLLSSLQSRGDYCKEIINYVSATGEITLFDNLKYKPSLTDKYEIYIINPDSIAQTNPRYHRLYWYDPDTHHYVNSAFVGGGRSLMGNKTNSDEKANGIMNITDNQTNIIYGNKALSSDDNNQLYTYSLFVQPNISIKEDMYKPCQLQLSTNKNKDMVKGYITNVTHQSSVSSLSVFPDFEYGEYNKFLTLDTLDDSQWLITFRTHKPLISNNYNLLMPQTPYKIYTNFVDSIPEAYFYLRPAKDMNFKYYDIYSDKEIGAPINDVTASVGVSAPSVRIHCDIFDQRPNNSTLTWNTTINKCYSYVLSDENGAVIAEQNKQYDGKFDYVVHGLQQDSIYKITIVVEDEYSHIYQLEEFFKINFTQSGTPKYSIDYEYVCDQYYNKITINELQSNAENDNEEQSRTNIIISYYRKHINASKWEYIVSLNKSNINELKDYNIASGDLYQYMAEIAYVTETVVTGSTSIETETTYRTVGPLNYIMSYWDVWNITDCQYDTENNIYTVNPNGYIYRFDKNINIGSISNNMNVVKYETLGKFNHILYNKQLYDSGELSALFGDFQIVQHVSDYSSYQIYNIASTPDLPEVEAIDEFAKLLTILRNNGYDIAPSVLGDQLQNNICLIYKGVYYRCTNDGTHLQWKEIPSDYRLLNDRDKFVAWKQFVSSHNVKLLKSPDGHKWLVAINDVSNYETNYNATCYPTVINFSWQEIDDQNKMIVGDL